jgi:hypothetical protein
MQLLVSLLLGCLALPHAGLSLRSSAAEAKSLGFDANAQLRVVYFLGGLQSDRGFNNRRWGLISWLCKLGLRSLFSIYDKSEAKLIRPERIPLGMNNVNCMFRNRRRR